MPRCLEVIDGVSASCGIRRGFFQNCWLNPISTVNGNKILSGSILFPKQKDADTLNLYLRFWDELLVFNFLYPYFLGPLYYEQSIFWLSLNQIISHEETLVDQPCLHHSACSLHYAELVPSFPTLALNCFIDSSFNLLWLHISYYKLITKAMIFILDHVYFSNLPSLATLFG